MAAQGLQDSAIAVLVDTCWQLRGLMGGAVEDGGYGSGIGDTTQRCCQLLRDVGAGSGVLQAVRFFPLCADGSGQHFLLDTFAVDFAEAHAVQHTAIGFLSYALR